MRTRCLRLLPMRLALALTAAEVIANPLHAQSATRPRARDVGVVIGVFPPGPLNAITDVAGVRVGHTTVIHGDSVRTGVTAIIPHPGHLYNNPVPAWIHVGNGYGKLVGETQVREFGEIESPILLTCTLCVWTAAKALVDWMLAPPDEPQHTVNPVVGETNDGGLSDMWRDPVRPDHVRAALESATSGAVAEGSVGAGTGTSALGFKGGIGTSSRRIPASAGGYTVGVLVQTNFGGILTINGAPVGRELGRYAFQEQLAPGPLPETIREDGSIMILVATDAPLDARNLDRLGTRAMMGLSRTGSYAANSSGDYVIAFSTAPSVRRVRTGTKPLVTESVLNANMSPLFEAVVEATEEAVINSLFRATTVTGRGRTVHALPIDSTVTILRKYNALEWDRSLAPGKRPSR
jgi:D-aminopeptidase